MIGALNFQSALEIREEPDRFESEVPPLFPRLGHSKF
jgi:hypothetical protein